MATPKTDTQLRDNLDQIIKLKIDYHENKERLMRKLHLLTFLPVDQKLNESKIPFHGKLLDELLSENALLTIQIEKIKREIVGIDRERASTEPLRKEKSQKGGSGERGYPNHGSISGLGTSSVLIRERKGTIAGGSGGNSNLNLTSINNHPHGTGIIGEDLIYTYNYNNFNDDGSMKPYSKEQLDLLNFQVLFRFFLQNANYPNFSTLSSTVHWLINPLRSQCIARLQGPEYSSNDDESYKDVASGKAISTYPLSLGRPYREGDPICDFYQIILYSNSAILCLTDGCNWGDKPRKASRIANKSIVKYLEKELGKIKTVKQAIHTLLASFTDGQLSILDNKEDFWMGGSTTAICCCLFSIDQDHAENSILQLSSSPSFSPSPFTLLPTPWVIVSVNVGDCKLFVFSPRFRTVFDVTHTTRDDVTNLNDPGGRLGSYNKLWPDLRNLSVYCLPVEEGDLVFVMSDGVHDNLDPQIQGVEINEFGISAPFDSWSSDSAQKPSFSKLIGLLKRYYMARFVELFIVADEELVTPRYLKDRLVDFCSQLTETSRNYLSENPQNRIPGDYGQYPGKVDHTSIACVKVGRYDSQVTEVLPTKTPKIDLTEFKKVKQKVIELVKSDLQTHHHDIYEEFFVQKQPAAPEPVTLAPGSLNSPPTSPTLSRDQNARKSTWLVVKPSNIQ